MKGESSIIQKLISFGLNLAGAVTGAAKIIGEMVGDVSNVLKDIKDQLNQVYTTKKRGDGIMDDSDDVVDKFGKEMSEQTTKMLIDQIKAVIKGAALTPILQSGLKFVADFGTEAAFKGLKQDAENSREKAKIEDILQKDDKKIEILNSKERVNLIFRLNELVDGGLLDLSSMQAKHQDAVIMDGSKKISLKDVVLNHSKENIYFSKRGDGYLLIKLSFSEMSAALSSGLLEDNIRWNLIATYTGKKVYVIDSKTGNPQEGGPNGFEPLGGKGKGEIGSAFEDGKFVFYDQKDGFWERRSETSNAQAEQVSVSSAQSRSPAGMTWQQEQAIANIKDVIDTVTADPYAKASYDEGLVSYDDYDDHYRLLPEQDQFWQDTQLTAYNEQAFLLANNHLFNHRLTVGHRLFAGAMSLGSYVGAGLSAYGAAVTLPTGIGTLIGVAGALYSFDKGNQYAMEFLTGQDSISLFTTMLSFGLGHPAASIIDDAAGLAFAAPGLYSLGRSAFGGLRNFGFFNRGSRILESNSLSAPLSQITPSLPHFNDATASLSYINPANSVADAQRLKALYALQEAGLIDNAGKVTKSAIESSQLALQPGARIGNPEIARELTKDGSKISDWQKLTTPSVTLSNGQRIQLHYYYNPVTKTVNYTYPDFKVKTTIDMFYGRPSMEPWSTPPYPYPYTFGK